jgi:hypothetical protein
MPGRCLLHLHRDLRSFPSSFVYIGRQKRCELPLALANRTRPSSASSKMALGVAVLVLSLPLLLLLTRAAWITVSCYCLTPMRIRRVLAGQGVRGPPARFLVGNLRDVSALVAEATAGDMGSVSHDIVGRLLPHYVRWSKAYGEFY